jgi:hypothetical protein
VLETDGVNNMQKEEIGNVKKNSSLPFNPAMKSFIVWWLLYRKKMS